jgi:glycosyltransferase involved in cell wall biosynthesis
VRLLAYDDQEYRRRGDELWTERTMPVFISELASELGEVTLIGRLAADEGSWNFRLPPGTGFVALPHYGSLSNPASVLAAGGRSLRAFWRALGDADAVLLFGPHPFALAFALLARARRKPVVLGVRQELRQYIRSRRPGRTGLRLAADVLEWSWRTLARRLPVVVVGPAIARQYARARQLLVLHVSTIRAADIVSAEESERSWDGDVRILSVGRLDAEKNPLLLAEVLARLNAGDRRWRMTVCGTGPLADALHARFRELGLEDRVEMAGYVPAGDRLNEVYRGSDVFLHVSWTEGVPQVLFEAFAAGVPVVATAVGGVPDAVAGGAALLVPPGELEPPVAALERLAADPEERRRLVERGLERVRSHTVEEEVGRLAAFLRSVSGPGAP